MMLSAKRFIEEVYTICEGWVAAGMIGEGDAAYPSSYDTLEEAVAEVVDFFSDVDQQIADGDREAEDGYDPDDWRIRDSQTGIVYEFTYGFESRLRLRLPDGGLRPIPKQETMVKL